MIELKVKKTHPNAIIHSKKIKTDSGIDLSLVDVEQKSENVIFFNMGISIEPPVGYYVEVYPRSSIYKTGFISANSVGIIDYEYRGTLFMPMIYLGKSDPLDSAKELIGQRIGQMILRKYIPFELREVDGLSVTSRGNGGFGSTGTT